MVSLNRANWRPLDLPLGKTRQPLTVLHVVHEAAQRGRLSQLEAQLDLLENRNRRSPSNDRRISPLARD